MWDRVQEGSKHGGSNGALPGESQAALISQKCGATTHKIANQGSSLEP